MFAVYDKDKQRVPIKIWLPDGKHVEAKCLEQALNLANLPFVYRQVMLMPDTHAGYGMPIGGVIGTKDVIIPHAVGNDIGCGMIFVSTNIPAKLLKDTDTPNGKLIQAMIGNILRNVPVGFSRHREPQASVLLDDAIMASIKPGTSKLGYAQDLIPEIETAYYQLGTLGGGNHFIEIQEYEEGLVCIMIHSGSRNFGKKICDFFNAKAQELNEKWLSSVTKDLELAFLPTDTIEGQSYIEWMNLALNFAQENRARMMTQVTSVIFNMVKKYTGFEGIEVSEPINAHHNYAALENHYGQNVWVHRKGAIRVRDGEMGIIPGAMGINSYIVKGKGNPESFYSCSHGAGRKMGRKEAVRQFSTEKVIADLKERGVTLGKPNKGDVAEECPWAYKDIDFVIAQEADLVEVVKKLKTVGVLKG